MNKIITAGFILLAAIATAQEKVDSLLNVWNDKNQPDTVRLQAINDLAWSYVFTKPDSALYYAEKSLNLAVSKGLKLYQANAMNNQGVAYLVQSKYDKSLQLFNRADVIYSKLEDSLRMAVVLNNIGLVHNGKGDFDRALEYFNKSLDIREKLNDKSGIATSLHTIGNIYQSRGDYANAMDFYSKSLRLKEEIGDNRGMANTYNNIGLLYREQLNPDKAFEYFNKSLEIRKEIGDDYGVAVSLSNIGVIFLKKEQYKEALDYFTRSLAIQEKLKDKEGMAINLGHIGNVYREQGEYKQAAENYERSLKIRKEISDKKGIASVLTNIGLNYLGQGNTARSIEYTEKALKLAQEIGSSVEKMEAAEALYQSYRQAGKDEKALKAYEQYVQFRDSVQSAKNQKELLSLEFRSAYEKKALKDSLNFAKQQEIRELEHKAEMMRARNRQYALYGGLGFFLILGLMAYGGYRRKMRDNKIISAQKELVEERNRKIWDSITYAQRIQNAILPPVRLVQQALPDSYIIYKPKDKVAGDFFWLEELGNTVLFAVADCTGHGVPGAIVSVVCNNALNRSVREFGLREPAKILDKTRELVIETFEKSEEEVKDGMDIALCHLDKKSLKLQYAGAHNSLYHITPLAGEIPERAASSQTHYLNEVKADRQPIGKHEKARPFLNHELQLKPGDVITLFTDGLADQFGGPKGKKFKYKPFRELLVSIQELPMEKQKEQILQALNNWKGDYEQVDDICVMGVRV